MNEKFPSKHDVDQAIKTGIKRTKGPIIQLFMAGGGGGGGRATEENMEFGRQILSKRLGK